MEIRKITVIGAGNMAICAAMSGFQVKCTDTNPDILAKAISFSDNYLKKRVAKGKLTEEAANQAIETLHLSQQLKKQSLKLTL
jgi:3-hydroxybutyryl-CoA dehydrogenase